MDVEEVRGELTSFSNVVQRCEKAGDKRKRLDLMNFRGVFVVDGGICVLLLMRHVVVVLKDKGLVQLARELQLLW
ncbi:hypothetical protein MKW98_017806 [Papaver atlanticum]|uniref:Uncharacterized protein n=1 Tax=Papaver atlanticum TaxID=357466 RepID=A0AAD4TER1_9MAGN|nr:hypothetical protein MKW98_017806 [Papaver atlanticum]